jgi:hypothetical protein
MGSFKYILEVNAQLGFKAIKRIKGAGGQYDRPCILGDERKTGSGIEAPKPNREISR